MLLPTVGGQSQRRFHLATRSTYFCNVTIQRQGVGNPQNEDDYHRSSVGQEPEERHVRQGGKHCGHDVWDSVPNNNAKGKHPSERAWGDSVRTRTASKSDANLQRPLSHLH